MSHTVRHAPAHHGRCSRSAMRRVRLWITLHRQLCECCGVALWGRRYTNAAYHAICRGCYLAGLPAQAAHEGDGQFAAQEEG
jgi:hypothetical protein